MHLHAIAPNSPTLSSGYPKEENVNVPSRFKASKKHMKRPHNSGMSLVSSKMYGKMNYSCWQNSSKVACYPVVWYPCAMSPQATNAYNDHLRKSLVAPPYYTPPVAENYVAMDCEMVGVGPGGHRSALARVSLIDFNGKILMDTFVQVDEEVTDYRTSVSGVCEENLTSEYAMSYKRCRRLVKKFVRHKILVGHGLINDFAVLQLKHPWYNIRDSSLYEPFMYIDQRCGTLRPRRLRDLCMEYLGISIQNDDRPHDSREDAWAAMRLYKAVQMDWDYTMGIQHSMELSRQQHRGRRKR